MKIKPLTFQLCITALAKIDPVYLENDQFFNSEKKKVAVLGQVSSGEQLESLPSLIGKSEIVVMNALDWQVDLIRLYLSSSAFWTLSGSFVAVSKSILNC